ncbi:helix-turn-helix transcriptional regulator [Hymenobacter psychrotolerans]|uniref:HTH cro/C1-type domain-containing protein n=1 Tax=Hymenobacter psychrotolerans DSM 18569 TaxID=1121959 RepID=A0A1M7F4J6_9BACT|nr:helix-turn-helix transcriptional regulator [Hymenobacter psychrotolerans]SHL98567.1 hypothetical protein SAMN02746009_03751 [Hymenobacter psychrotolerans DSM 18569]
MYVLTFGVYIWRLPRNTAVIQKMKNTTVGQRFTQLISHLGISKNAFAASLDKTATVIQHLVDERNKPGFDLMCKVFEVYPNVSKDWLLQGVGPMLTDTPKTSEAAAPPAKENEPALAAGAVAPASEVAVAPPVVEAAATTAAASAATPLPGSEPADQSTVLPATAAAAPEAAPPTIAPVSEASLPAPVVPAPSVAASDTSWQTALYTQQMAHQLALAELRNQHLQEQQRLMQQMMDLMQRQLTR